MAFELYTLDNLLRREAVIDKFESLIWSERFQAEGDFELSLQSTIASRSTFTAGRWLAFNKSVRVMQVDTVEDGTDSEGRNILKVKGPSIERVLDDRVARGAMTSTTVEAKWVLTGLPAAIARKVFHDICELGTLSSNDIIPFMTTVDILPDDTLPEPPDSVTIELEIQSVYSAVKGICDLYDLGFRLIRNYDNSQLAFQIYAGSDRTTGQDVLPSVLFSPDLNNLTNTTELTSVSGAKNVAYVFSPVGYRIVTPQDVDPATPGFDRHVLVVVADDITDPTPSIANALMDQRGKEELSKNRAFAGFDGEISQSSQYIYGVDYQLGDLVEQRNVDGVANVMRVSEQIFVSDNEGERSYPTLTIYKFITPGSWLSWNYNQTWLDLNSDPLVWQDAP
jgi:hypothetical protein